MNLSEKSDNSKTHYTDNISLNNKINDFETNTSHYVRKNIIKKYGSFQKFIISDDVAANYSNSLFSNKYCYYFIIFFKDLLRNFVLKLLF